MELQELDEKIIEGHEWAIRMRRDLSAFTDKCVLNWCKIVIELGENEVELDKWVNIFRGQIEERCKELILDVYDMKERVIDTITQLLGKTQSYADELGLKEDVSDINPNEGFYQVKKELLKRTERLEKMVLERRRELDSLIEKQKSLCTLLDKTPYSISASPFPSKEKIEKFQQYVETMEQEKFDREEKYLNLKEAIVTMAKELQLVPKSDFERDILSDGKTDFDISKSNMEHLKKYHDEMVNQLKSVREEIDTLRHRVDNLWTILEESMTERDSFHDRNPGYSMSTLEALRAEVKRCEDLKKANIKIFVERLRTELRSLWPSCYHTNEEVVGDYPWFTSDFYTEDLLLHHEREVEKWRSFYSRNRELIKLFAEHEKLWTHLLQMENKDSDGVDRFKNRGGQLLREEKERNKLSKKIPQIEEKLKQLAMDFEDYHGSPFKIFGTPILDHIDNLHFQRDQDRKNKLSARKQIREKETLTPAKSCMNLFPSSSKLCPTPQPLSAIKRKLKKPATTGKKPKIESAQKEGLNISSISIKRQRRLSEERKMRLVKCRKFLNMKSSTINKENLDMTQMTDYDAFERNLTSRDDNVRSTLNALDPRSPMKIIPTLMIIPATPATSKTPNTAGTSRAAVDAKTPNGDEQVRTPKTPKISKQLTRTPSSLKLIF